MEIGYFDTFMRVTVVRFLNRTWTSVVDRWSRSAKIKTCERMWLTPRIMAVIFQRRKVVKRLVNALVVTSVYEYTGGNGTARSTLASGRNIYKLFKFLMSSYWRGWQSVWSCFSAMESLFQKRDAISFRSSAEFCAHQNSIDCFSWTLLSSTKKNKKREKISIRRRRRSNVFDKIEEKLPVAFDALK